MADLVQTADAIVFGAIVTVSVLCGAAAAGIALGVQAALHWARTRRLRQPQVPAAPDNQPGTNTDALWECRRIHATSNPQTRKEKP
ncbi:hypothetical protein C9F11_37995 [Streptomyces sp. YIM 121038]|uniref:hypothetical protein n=1 Tax=Streptomyces sp. YIM 121038 TaxID=2136401 RepID=UPI001110DE7A|nr:hypothetical protein [Streptomyces sp. YIM 121038]QCX81182.1 hypothetical protein C9F11_37995 [Streptomyces sp. YIM 121038]